MLMTRSSAFPATGDWTATFAFRYTRIAHYGTSVGCTNANGDYVARVHEDVSGQFVQINGKGAATHPADTDWHVASFVKKSNTIAIYLDGIKAGADTIPSVPLSLGFGGIHVDDPGLWNNQEVQYVRVDRGEKVLDRTALSAFTPSSVAAIEPNQVSAPIMVP